jgi:quinol monooxygenase YgiN
MVTLVVTWIAHAGREADTARVLKALAIASRGEPGCLMFAVHQHRTDPARFLIFERFEDDAALEAHRAAPHFLTLAKGELPAVAVRVEGNLYSEL